MQLHFQSHGAGFPLVVLHGLLGSSDNWQSLARFWGETFQVFTLDLRNHGQSPHADDIDYKLMAEDVVEFFASQNFQRAHLLGHSMGGKVAMQVALNHPETVEKLVVVDMAPRAYAPSHIPIFDAMIGLNLTTFKERSEIDAALAAHISDNAIRQFVLKNVRREADGSFAWKVNLDSLREHYPELIAALKSDTGFEHLALFIRGGKSDYIRDEDEKLIHQFFPRAKIETIPEAGHWVNADAPLKLRQMVLDFLSTDKLLQ